MSQILAKIRQELNKNIDLQYKAGAKRFFKEKVNPLGVRTPITRKIANKYYQEIKNKDKKEILSLCEELLEKKTFEETLIAFSWARKQNNTEKEFDIFEKWLKKYVDNWAYCDDFCTHAFGELLRKYPQFLPRVKFWTKSKNRWLRRASAVILIPLYKDKKYLKNFFETADILLLDKDDLVQKGYGWSLKVASDAHPREVFDFVMKRKEKMPRTALRYAIEKYPKEMRLEAMK
jgi:3-methyladenine DNA glycosylase AlkD